MAVQERPCTSRYLRYPHPEAMKRPEQLHVNGCPTEMLRQHIANTSRGTPRKLTHCEATSRARQGATPSSILLGSSGQTFCNPPMQQQHRMPKDSTELPFVDYCGFMIAVVAILACFTDRTKRTNAVLHIARHFWQDAPGKHVRQRCGCLQEAPNDAARPDQAAATCHKRRVTQAPT